jgi:hypothetical protein
VPDPAATGASVVIAAIVVASSTVVVAFVTGYARPGSRCTGPCPVPNHAGNGRNLRSSFAAAGV